MNLPGAVCPNRPSAKVAADQSLNERRLQILEAQCAEFGARLAGLEGCLFALHRQLIDFESRLTALINAPTGVDS